MIEYKKITKHGIKVAFYLLGCLGFMGEAIKNRKKLKKNFTCLREIQSKITDKNGIKLVFKDKVFEGNTDGI